MLASASSSASWFESSADSSCTSVARGTLSHSSALSTLDDAATAFTTFAPSLSIPFHAPQPLHLHRPNSSSVRTPGGAWPLTRRHLEHSNTNLFLAAVSSSP